MKTLLLVLGSSLLLACAEPSKEEQSAIEQAGHEAGEIAARELHEPIDQAKNLQDEMNAQAEALDEKIDEQTSEEADPESP